MKYKKFELSSGESIRKSRTELMAECLKLGLPIRRDDTYKTLQLFLELMHEKENLFIEDENGIEKKVVKRFFIEKLFNNLSEKIKFLFR